MAEIEDWFNNLDYEHYIATGKLPYKPKVNTNYNSSKTYHDYSCEDYEYQPMRTNYKIQLSYTILRCDELQIQLRENIIVDTCPVCMNPLKEVDNVTPNCGHKICVGCFVNNLKYNKTTGHSCVLCRKNICG